jgi:hypothetical protein
LNLFDRLQTILIKERRSVTKHSSQEFQGSNRRTHTKVSTLESAYAHKTSNVKDFAFMACNIHNIFGFDCQKIKGSYNQESAHAHKIEKILDFDKLDQNLLDQP